MGQELDARGAHPSASNWPRYERCHGAFQLEREAMRLGQAAYQAQTPEAERGTRIHAYLAGIPDEDGNEIILSESEQQTADFLQERAQGEIKRIFGDQPTKRLVEKRLWLKA